MNLLSNLHLNLHITEKNKNLGSKDEWDIVDNPTNIKEINNQSDTSKRRVTNKKKVTSIILPTL